MTKYIKFSSVNAQCNVSKLVVLLIWGTSGTKQWHWNSHWSSTWSTMLVYHLNRDRETDVPKPRLDRKSVKVFIAPFEPHSQLWFFKFSNVSPLPPSPLQSANTLQIRTHSQLYFFLYFFTCFFRTLFSGLFKKFVGACFNQGFNDGKKKTCHELFFCSF